jgi:hypothetical protein
MIRKPEKLVKFINAKAFYFSLVLIAILCGTSFGQSITWQRTYDGRDGVADGGYTVCKADGNNFYICGYSTYLPNNKRVYVIKINSLGDTIWTRSIQIGTTAAGGSCLSSVTSSDDGCVLTGETTYAFTIKVDKNGEVIWNYNYGLFGKQLYEIINTSDGGYIACGRDYEDINDNAFLLKIDSLGNLQWYKTFYSSYWKNFESIAETNNNDGYLVGGFNKNFQTDTTKAILLKVNQNGDSLWQKHFDHNIVYSVLSITNLPNGYLLAGNNVINNLVQNAIYKIDENANVTFHKTIESDSSYKILTDLKIINVNKYVISSSKQFSSGLLLTVDSSGNIINEKVYTSPDFLTIRSALPIDNGDIIFTGVVDFDTIFTKNDVYALRTDSLLNGPPPIGVNQINNKIPKFFKLFQNYPNPFNPETSIRFDIPQSSNVTIKVYDILGKEVFSLNEYKLAGSYEVKFDGSNLASGMYFYSLETKGYKDVKKMVLLK